MNPIPGLLEKHWDELHALKKEYWGYALSTAPADRDRLQHAVAEIYELHNLEAPQMVWMESLLDAKLCNALYTYLSDPNVYYSLEGPFGLYGGKERFMMTYTNYDEENHKQKIQREFPTLYTESEKKESVSERIWKTKCKPNIDGSRLYQTLHGIVGVVSENPLKLVLPEFGGVLPDGAEKVYLFSGDTIQEPLPNILDLSHQAFLEGFGKQITEIDDAQILSLWSRYDINHLAWREFGPKFKNMSQEGRAEILRYLTRITAINSFGCFNPLRDSLSSGRNHALEIMGKDRHPENKPFTDAVKAGGWWWPFDGVCLAFDNPSELHVNERKELHNEDGLAIRFRDNWGFVAYHGHRKGISMT